MNTPTLFDIELQPTLPLPEPSYRERRKAAMDAAFAHADERFKEEYERLLMRFVEQGREFTGEDVQAAYRERTYLPQPRGDFRATGAIYSRLRKQGIIAVVGYRPRENGNMTSVYRKKV